MDLYFPRQPFPGLYQSDYDFGVSQVVFQYLRHAEKAARAEILPSNFKAYPSGVGSICGCLVPIGDASKDELAIWKLLIEMTEQTREDSNNAHEQACVWEWHCSTLMFGRKLNPDRRQSPVKFVLLFLSYGINCPTRRRTERLYHRDDHTGSHFEFNEPSPAESGRLGDFYDEP
ncbi:hypothetical protein FCN77_09480 [Arthrobacter sp. 24S4-2]|nr:hypothetical protein FCN77_09480 [Arthrobacter sp. 24S4-2]